MKYATQRPFILLFAALPLAALVGTGAWVGLQNTSAPALAVAPTPPFGKSGMISANRLAYVENRGQWDAQAKFMASVPGANIWITDGGVVYDFSRTERTEPQALGSSASRITVKKQGHVVRMEFVGARGSQTRGEGLQEGVYNYIVGRDESRWASNVPRFAEVRSERIYDGVEARYYFDQGSPRYDLIVAPGADASQIRLRFEGAKGVSAQGSSLKLQTSLGEVQHRELFAYQKIDGATRQVPCSFRATGNTVTFSLGAHDRTKPLVIDPLIWSTFLGGEGHDAAYDVAIVGIGQPVVGGYTQSGSFPTSVGAYDTAVSSYDAFVSKFTKDGSDLIYSTFYGGSGQENCFGLDVDSAGNIAIVGDTSSTDLPMQPGAFDSTANGNSDAFVATLSSDGTSLVMATYIGGASSDVAYEVAFDSLDRPVLVGNTNSADFPTTAGAFQTTFGGSFDGFVCRVAANGTSLNYSTFLGGDSDDGLRGVVIDSSDRPVVVGYSQFGDYPVTTGAFDETHNGNYDAVVSRLSANGSNLQASTYVGGTLGDTGNDVCLDTNGKVVLAGVSSGGGFPVSVGAHRTEPNLADGYVIRLNAALTAFEAGTFVGGSGFEQVFAVGTDAYNRMIIAGYTQSADLATTAGAFDRTHNGGDDVFVAKVSQNASKLLYSTFIGGANSERAQGLAVDPGDPTGNTIVVGQAATGYPTTVGAYDTTHNGLTYDAFITKVATAPALRTVSFPGSKVVGGFVAQLTITLNQPASTTTVVNLSTNNPGKVLLPATTKIKQGQTSKTFGVRTETVLADTAITVSGTYNGGTSTVNLTLNRGGLQSLKLTGNTIQQMTAGSGTANLSGPAQQNRTVTLSSSNMSALNPGASVMVPQNSSNANFTINAGAVATSTNVTISGTLGAMTRTDTMTVNP